MIDRPLLPGQASMAAGAPDLPVLWYTPRMPSRSPPRRLLTPGTRIGPLDCQRCGACCVNPSENREEGYAAYVEVEPGASLWRRPDLVRKYVREDLAEGRPHLRLTPEGRCLGLQGALGRRVWCALYAHRPGPCRRVEAGSDLCLRYRRDAGLE